MHFKSSKYSSKYSGPKIALSSNLSPSLHSTIVVGSRIWQTSKILTFLVQFAILDFQLWLESSDDQYLGHCTQDWDTLAAFYFLLFYKTSHKKRKKDTARCKYYYSCMYSILYLCTIGTYKVYLPGILTK